jgi:D-amino peptidase
MERRWKEGLMAGEKRSGRARRKALYRKIYIMVDFEGIAGFLEWDDYDENSPKRHRLRTFLSNETNAAVTACFESGAEEVIVWDSHGPFGNCNNIYLEMLHPDVQVIQGNKGLPSFYPMLNTGFDAAMYIGMHAMEGTPHAVVPHTKTVLNGHELGEGGMFLAMCSYLRVPVLFISGDAAAIDQVLALAPQIEHVKTKWAFGPYAARTRTPAKSCELIAAGVKKALSRKAKVPSWDIRPPYVFEDGRRRVEGENLWELYHKEWRAGAKWGDQDVEPQRSQVMELRKNRPVRYN